MDKNKKDYKKIYEKKIDNNFLFKFEKDKNVISKKYNIEYYVLKNNKIIELRKK